MTETTNEMRRIERETAMGLGFKSPYRSDAQISVLDVLEALEVWARHPRGGLSASFTYGELEIGVRMAREALAVTLDRIEALEGALRGFAIYEVEGDDDHLYVACGGVSVTVPRVGQVSAVLRQIEALQRALLSPTNPEGDHSSVGSPPEGGTPSPTGGQGLRAGGAE